jgi:hypothetical protein
MEYLPVWLFIQLSSRQSVARTGYILSKPERIVVSKERTGKGAIFPVLIGHFTVAQCQCFSKDDVQRSLERYAAGY